MLPACAYKPGTDSNFLHDVGSKSFNQGFAKDSARHCQQTLLTFFLAAFTISCERAPVAKCGVQAEAFTDCYHQQYHARRDVAGEIIDAHAGCFNSSTDVFTSTGWLNGTNESSLALNCPFRFTARRILNDGLMKVNCSRINRQVLYPSQCGFQSAHSQYVLWYNCFPTVEWPKCSGHQ